MSDVESVRFSGMFGGYSDYSTEEESDTEKYMDVVMSDMLRAQALAASQQTMNVKKREKKEKGKNKIRIEEK